MAARTTFAAELKTIHHSIRMCLSDFIGDIGDLRCEVEMTLGIKVLRAETHLLLEWNADKKAAAERHLRHSRQSWV